MCPARWTAPAQVALRSAGPIRRAGVHGTSPSALSKLDGSGTVINTGGTEVKGLEPAPVIVFDTAASNVSGFDGCKNFKGTYTFEGGLLGDVLGVLEILEGGVILA